MNKSAVLHIPLSQFAYAMDEHSLVIRLRAEKNDIKKCVLFYGDRVDPNPVISVKELPMKLVAQDDLFDYFEAEIQDIYTRVCYYFLLDDGNEREYYYERSFCREITTNRTEYFQFPYIRREDIIEIPEWAESLVMYHIFPDSFASEKAGLARQPKRMVVGEERESVSYLGGTLAGVRENLGYLRDLGVNCIYLNPIFAANSYHKYDTIDYFSIDPCFGTNEEFRELVQACHNYGIRVLLDGVFNHCGPQFFAFEDVVKKGRHSDYYDWFYYMPEPILYQDPPSYEAFAYVKEMPKLNTGNEEVAKYFAEVGAYWIREYDIDGWRLDVANEINHDFWRKFRTTVKREKEDVFLIAEIWEDAGEWLKGDQFDSSMNYRFSYLCKDFFATREMKVSEFDGQIQRMLMRYPNKVSHVQMNFLDSHDVPRFLSYCNGDRKRMELAFFYLMMCVGIPSVFYGDEYYIEGCMEPEYRRAMPWGQECNCIKQLQEWIAIRKKYKALQKGGYRSILCDDTKNIYVFERYDKENTIRIILNNAEEDYLYKTKETLRVLHLEKCDTTDAGFLIKGMTGMAFLVEK